MEETRNRKAYRLRAPRGLRKRIREAASALMTMEREEVSPAGKWILEHAGELLNQADALNRETRFLPPLPGRDGEPRLLALARMAAAEEEITAPGLVRCLRESLEGEEITQAELDALPLALRRVLLEALVPLLDACVQEKEMVKKAREWAEAFVRGTVQEAPGDRELLARAMLHLDQLEQPGALNRLRDALARRGVQGENILAQAQAEEAARGLEAGRLIASLRRAERLPYDAVNRRLSPVEALLRQDASYPKMDHDSREYYLRRVCRLAEKYHAHESSVAQAALSLARGKQGPEGETGYYLIERTDQIGAALGWKTYAFARRHRTGLFLLPLYCSAALFLGLGVSFGAPWFTWPLIPLCASEAVRAVYFPLLRRIFPARMLPRLHVRSLRESQRTLVVIPCLLTGEKQAMAMARQLAALQAANPDPCLEYMLLADFADSDQAAQPQDDGILLAARLSIEALNGRGAGRFLYLHRARTWDQGAGRFTGRERKRGALEALNRMIAGETCRDTFLYMSLTPAELQGRYAFVITLDADTFLPAGEAHKLVGTMLHPLQRGRVHVVQPRMAVGADTVKTKIQRLLGGGGGADPYHLSMQDLYQDIFGKGSFVGKGIYAPGPWLKALENRLPEGRLLSHDLIEGETAGSALADDIVLYDGHPASLSGWQARLHRWTRGDWQLLSFLADRRLSLLSRHKIWDNLRRSLIPAAQTALLITGAALSSPALFLLGLPWPLRGMGARLLFLPGKGYTLLDAAVRALWRQFVSHRHLLSWITAAQADGGQPTLSSLLCHIGAGTALLLLSARPGGFWPGLLPGTIWVSGPLLMGWMNASLRLHRPMTKEQKENVRKLARDTWRFFEMHVSEGTRFLPPDNVQLEPFKGPAMRTSPTNAGMYLLSCCAARELGFISSAQLAARLDETLCTLESLEKWKGHCYNWYDLKDASALPPRFVSTVDSGNLTACLLCCAQICRRHIREFPEEKRNVPARLDALARQADFRALYDERKQLFHIGCNGDTGRLTAVHYDRLASEARLTSFTAIILGQVKRRHWARLGRAVVRAGGGPALLSWSGTLFEYLMPQLLLPLYPGTLLGESCLNAVRAQMSEGSARPFGVSESGCAAFDLDMNYQYRAFGLPILAQSPEAGSSVTAPYASMLALPFFPWAAAENLKQMQRLGWQDEQGLFEAADYTRNGAEPVVIKSHMAHHQGMILCAACNALMDNVLVRAFMTPPMAQAHRDLLMERAPAAPPRRKTEIDAPIPSPLPEKLARRPQPGLPLEAHALSGGGTAWVISANGQSMLRHRGIQMTRFFPQAGSQTGPQFYVQEETTERFFRPAAEGKPLFESGAAVFGAAWEGLLVNLRCCVDPLTGMAVASLRTENPGPEDRTLRAVSFLEVALSPQAADRAHSNFQDLSVQVLPWGRHGLLARRLPREEGETAPCMGHIALGDGMLLRRQGDRTNFLGRGGSYAAPEQLAQTVETRTGDVIAPCLSLTVSFSVPAHSHATVYFVTLFAFSPEALEEQKPSAARARAAFSLASARESVIGRRLHMTVQEMGMYQQILGAMLFEDQPHRFFYPMAPRRALWAFGVSGELPVLLVRLQAGGGTALIRHALKAHAWMRMQGVEFDLMFLCPPEEEYRRPLREQLNRCLDESPEKETLGAPGGVHIGQGGDGEESALKSLCALALRTNQSLKEQLSALRTPLHQGEAIKALLPRPDMPEEWTNFLGYGGCTREGAFWVTAAPPVPWHHLVCGASFGTLLCDSGILMSYTENSRLGRLTRLAPDVYRGEPSEEIYLRDGEGRFWPLTRGAAAYEPGLAEYRGSTEDIAFRTAVFSHPEQPMGIRAVSLRSEHEQRATLYWLVRFAMGEDAAPTRCLAEEDMVFARGGDLPGVAWAAMKDGQGRSLCDPIAFGLRGEALPPALFSDSQGQGSVGLLTLEITLPVRERVLVPLALGYAPDEALARRQRTAFWEEGPGETARRVRADWSKRLSAMTLFSNEEKVNWMMNLVLPYQVRSSRLMARMGPYQIGGAIGFRDQLQDCLALLHTEPQAVREHLLLCAAHQFQEGDVMHWWHPERMGVRTRISDDQLFLPWMTAQYVKVTGDESILDAPAPYLLSAPLSETERDRYEIPGLSPWTEPLLSHCLRAIDAMALGPHGLPLMGGGDWNDGMNRVGGESVWLAFFLALVLKEISPLCPAEIRERYTLLRRRLLDGAENAWTGQWYLRAWYADGRPLGGPQTNPPRIDLISQCFSVLGGAPKNHARQALSQAVEKLYDRNHGIVKLLWPPFTPEENAGYIGGYLPGVRENGGQYTHAVPWLIQALCRVGESALAWEITRAILPAHHADTKEKAALYRAEPYVLCGDVYAGENLGRGGWSWYTGSAAWLYWVILTELLGFEKRGDKARLRPAPDPERQPFTLVYRFGRANYHFSAAPDVLFPTLDGVKLDDGWAPLLDDGKTHEARFPL